MITNLKKAQRKSKLHHTLSIFGFHVGSRGHISHYYGLTCSDSAPSSPTLGLHMSSKRFRLQMTQGENMKLTPTELSEPVLGLEFFAGETFCPCLEACLSASSGFGVGSV